MITDREESAGKTTNSESKLPNGKTMTRDDIISMAREAGGADITSHGWTSWVGTQSTDFLERFAALVAAHERERIIAANAPEIEKVNEYIKALEERPWVGLTDEEIQNIGFEAADRESAVIQAEDKLKEKNGG